MYLLPVIDSNSWITRVITSSKAVSALIRWLRIRVTTWLNISGSSKISMWTSKIASSSFDNFFVAAFFIALRSLLIASKAFLKRWISANGSLIRRFSKLKSGLSTIYAGAIPIPLLAAVPVVFKVISICLPSLKKPVYIYYRRIFS